MKKLILTSIVLLLITFLFIGCGNQSVDSIPNELEEAVKSTFLNDNQNRYLSGECKGEGHIILGQDKKANNITVYALAMYGEYGFENGNFVKVSGSGVTPVIFTFMNSENGLISTKVEYPEKDGSGHSKSMEKLFTPKYGDRNMKPSESVIQNLESQERLYAENYLKEIGRDAIIGHYGDFEYTLLTDVGVSIDVSNKICGEKYSKYPIWIGNSESVENGIRYVYEMSYNEEANEINFIKYEYDTKTIVEKICLDSITGLQVTPSY